MTVRNLIAELKCCNPDALVLIDTPRENGGFSGDVMVERYTITLGSMASPYVTITTPVRYKSFIDNANAQVVVTLDPPLITTEQIADTTGK
jgi:hypothetical protein